MQRLRITRIKPGQKFDGCLFSLGGQKLLPPGVELSARHIEALQRYGELEVFVAESVEELIEAGVVERFDSTKLQVGERAQRDLLSSNGRVVVEANQEIEAHHVQALAAGGNAFESTSSENSSGADEGGHRRERVLVSDARSEALVQQSASMNLHVTPLETLDWVQPEDPTLWPDREALTAVRDEHIQTLRHLFANTEAGVEMEVARFEALIEDLIERLRYHPTRFPQLALLCKFGDDYLPDHAYTVAVLAMSAACQMKWPESDVRQVGLAGLLFDLGMLLVPERIRVGACQLTDVDRQRVQRHPIFSVGMLDCIKGVDPLVELAALQHHERENGAGYPYGLRSARICDYGRLLAVSDVYAAITEPRSFRKQKLPYVAMEETLRNAASLLLWKPAVRALIQAAGLFPVGSFVRLSDGKNAHVLASNPQALDRPVIEYVNAEGQCTGKSLDLATINKSNLTVVRPIADPRER